MRRCRQGYPRRLERWRRHPVVLVGAARMPCLRVSMTDGTICEHRVVCGPHLRSPRRRGYRALYLLNWIYRVYTEVCSVANAMCRRAAAAAAVTYRCCYCCTVLLLLLPLLVNPRPILILYAYIAIAASFLVRSIICSLPFTLLGEAPTRRSSVAATARWHQHRHPVLMLWPSAGACPC